MIYSLDGTLTYFDQNFAVVSCGGVGFKCFTTLTTLQSLPGVGKPVQLFTYLSVREDALDLYGFATTAELDCFKLLISVNGVGPKAALAILSELSADRLAVCIAGGDAKSLTRVPGIGKKIAERIVLELKDKMGVLDLGSSREVQAAAAANTAGSVAAEAVDTERIRAFLATPLAQEIRQARQVWREYRFALLMPAALYDPAAEGEELMLQGVVDCAFRTEEGLVVVDFKTDRLAPGEEPQRAEEYRPQLEAYAQALERVMEEKVCRKVLYFFSTGATINL